MRYDKAVWDAGDLTSTEKLVALAYSQPTYAVGAESNSSFAQIAGLVVVTRGTVIIATKALVAKNYLTVVEKREFQPSIYRTRLPSAPPPNLRK